MDAPDSSAGDGAAHPPAEGLTGDPAADRADDGDGVDAPGATSRGWSRRALMGTLWSLAVLVYVLDQVTKWLAVEHLTGRPPVQVVGELVQLRLLYNPGAAFSIATGLTWVLTILATVVVLVVVRISTRLGSRGWAVALGLLLAGATGNLTDRFLREPGFARGHVVDFIALPNFPVFNVADSAICVAAALIALLAVRGIGVDGVRDRDRERLRAAAAAGDGDADGAGPGAGTDAPVGDPAAGKRRRAGRPRSEVDDD